MNNYPSLYFLITVIVLSACTTAFDEDVSDITTRTDCYNNDSCAINTHYANDRSNSVMISSASLDSKICTLAIYSKVVTDNKDSIEYNTKVTIDKIVVNVSADENSDTTFLPEPIQGVRDVYDFSRWNEIPNGISSLYESISDDTISFAFHNSYKVTATVYYAVRTRDDKLAAGFTVFTGCKTVTLSSNKVTYMVFIPISLTSVKFDATVDSYHLPLNIR